MLEAILEAVSPITTYQTTATMGIQRWQWGNFKISRSLRLVVVWPDHLHGIPRVVARHGKKSRFANSPGWTCMIPWHFRRFCFFAWHSCAISVTLWADQAIAGHGNDQFIYIYTLYIYIHIYIYIDFVIRRIPRNHWFKEGVSDSIVFPLGLNTFYSQITWLIAVSF